MKNISKNFINKSGFNFLYTGINNIKIYILGKIIKTEIKIFGNLLSLHLRCLLIF